MDSPSKVLSVDTEEKKSLRNRISFVTGGSGLSSSFAAFTYYFTKAAKSAIKHKSLKSFSISGCVKERDRVVIRQGYCLDNYTTNCPVAQ